MDESRVTFSLNRLVALLNGHADTILRARFDITYSQFTFLLCLTEGPLSLTEAADMQGVSVAAVSKRVPWFVERGLVRTASDADHARKVLIALTPSGRRLAAKSSADLEQAFRDKFTDMQDVDLAGLNQTLAKIITQLADRPKEKP
jgi:DNA-binding MarR family transcriptional regulator